MSELKRPVRNSIVGVLLILLAFLTFVVSIRYSTDLAEILIPVTDGRDAFSSFTALLLRIVLSGCAFVLLDRFTASQLDTASEIRAGNTAYGLRMIALAIVVAGANVGV